MFSRSRGQHTTPIQGESGDAERLRATLRLMFDGPTSDRIARTAGQREGRLAFAAIRRWQFEHWRARLGRGVRDDPRRRVLSPAMRAPARGAVALALQVGLGTTGNELASATRVDAEQIGIDLYRVRANLTPGGTPPCGEFTSSIGRYRDLSLDLSDRALLLHHAQHCDNCRNTIERFREIDAMLVERIEREETSLPASVESGHQGHRRIPVTVLTAVAALFVLALAGVLVLSSRQQPGPAAAGTPNASSDRLTGWILTQDINGEVTAIDLQTGMKRPVGPTEALPANQQYGIGSASLSPNKQLIARQEPIGQPNAHSELTIFTINGKLILTVEFPDRLNMHLEGWLGDDTILEVKEPFQELNQPFNDYVKGLQSDSTVVAVNVLSGQQQEIFRGSVSAVFPSPDRSLIVMRTWADALGGPTQIELRPMQNGDIGDVIASLTLGYNSDPVWAPDSSRFYVAMNPPESSTATGSPTPLPNAGLKPLRTVAVSRSGYPTQTPPLPGDLPSYPVAISPDGRLLYEVSMSADAPGLAPKFRLWRVPLSGIQATALTGPSPTMIQHGSWSQDGRIFMVQDYHPFLFGPSVENASLGDVWSTSILAIFPDGRTEIVRSQMGSTFGMGFLGWVPETTFPDAMIGRSGGQPAKPAAVDLQPSLQLDGQSQTSPDGKYVVLHDSASGTPLIWDRSTESGRRLPLGITDLSWLPQSDQLIAVGKTGSGQRADFSRIMTFAPTFTGSVPSYDFRAYDPANIGDATDTRYAEPLFAPDQASLAFFTVDDRNATVTLWTAQYGSQTQPVYHWSVPADSKIGTTPVAAWFDDNTLLFTEPGNWHDGLPRQVRLQRLVLDPGGTAQVDTLVALPTPGSERGTAQVDTLATLRTHGSERGVDLRELSVSQQSGRIAFRLRHFTQLSASSGAFDSVDIVTLAHVDSPIELSRQGSATGIDWSPDGTVLAAAFPGEIRFYSMSGELLGKIAGMADPVSPRWVSSSEVWFNAAVDGTDRVMSVQMH